MQGRLKAAGVAAYVLAPIIAWYVSDEATRGYLLLALPIWLSLTSPIVLTAGIVLLLEIALLQVVPFANLVILPLLAAVVAGLLHSRRGDVFRKLPLLARGSRVRHACGLLCYTLAGILLLSNVFTSTKWMLATLLGVSYIVFGRFLRRDIGARRISMRSVSANALALAVGLLFAAVVLEMGARWFVNVPPPPPPAKDFWEASDYSLWVPRPSIQERHFVTGRDHDRKEFVVTHSSQRLRGPEIGPKAENEFRIALLGDSQTYGWGVHDQDTVASRLQAIAGRPDSPVTVLNFGVPGYAPWQELGRLKHEALAFEPDAVVVQLFPSNDVHDTIVANGGLLEAISTDLVGMIREWQGHSHWSLRWERNLRRSSAAYNAYRETFPGADGIVDVLQDTRFAPRRAAVWAPEAESNRTWWLETSLKNWYPELERAWSIYERDTLEIARFCAEQELPVLFFCLPNSMVTDEGWQQAIEQSSTMAGGPVEYVPYKETRLTEAFLKEHELASFSMLDRVLALDDPESLYIVDDGHLNEAGCQFVAERILEALVQFGFLRVDAAAPARSSDL